MPTDAAIQPLIEKMEKDDSLFARAVLRLHRSGVKNAFQAAALENPERYAEWRKRDEGSHTERERKTYLCEPVTEEETLATHKDGLMHGELRALEHMKPSERPKGILAFAQRSPREYSEARRRNLI